MFFKAPFFTESMSLSLVLYLYCLFYFNIHISYSSQTLSFLMIETNFNIHLSHSGFPRAFVISTDWLNICMIENPYISFMLLGFLINYDTGRHFYIHFT